MSYTEFYCDAATGANINAGDNKTIVTSTNGDWGNAAANRFTAASGTPFSGVSVGDFASVYLDGATTAVYVARVTAVNAGGASLTLSSTAKSGTAPTNSATGRSCTVGGKWKGPNAAENFPFGFVQSTMTDASGDVPRVNLKSGTNYAITAAMTHGNAGPARFQGYTSSAGDGGRAIIDGGTSGTSYTLLTLSAAQNDLVDLIFQNNGATGSADGLNFSGNSAYVRGVVVNSVRGSGFNSASSGRCIFEEDEAYSCNQSNTSGTAGFRFAAGNQVARRCDSHDNSGSNSIGFQLAASTVLEDCIADTNGGVGINVSSAADNCSISGCDMYNNGSHGLSIGAGFPVSIVNSNFVKNGGYGINGTSTMHGAILNCAFGSGTQANTLGTVNSVGSVDQIGTITYASGVTPWVDPANGDFRINLAAAKGTGRGVFTQTQASYTGTVSYPDCGSAQHQDSGGSTLIIVEDD